MNNIIFKKYIKKIKDFPTSGVLFYDITPLLENGPIFSKSIEKITDFFNKNKIDKVVTIESRGFIIASPVAYLLKRGLVLLRREDRLPRKTLKKTYNSEYKKNVIEMNINSINKNENVLIVDDVLATGGTAVAAIDMIESVGGNVIGLSFLLEISNLNGRKKLSKYNTKTLIKY